MYNKIIYSFCLFCGFAFSATAQQLPKLPAEWATKITAATNGVNPFDVVQCEPDSLLGYGFASPSDSVLFSRHIFRKYDGTATTSYLYNGIPPLLMDIDSNVFDAMGRTIFYEHWEFDGDSNAVVLKSRTFSYPHGNTLSNDSVIFHQTGGSGVFEQSERTVHLFSPTDQILETQEFSWEGVTSMSWYQNSKTLFFYSGDGTLAHSDEYFWNGTEFALTTTNNYTYNADGFANTIITTDIPTGMPTQKLEFSYDEAANSTLLVAYIWDDVALEWVQFFYVLTDLDDQGRVDLEEFVIDFFGTVTGIREDYEYLGGSTCPWRRNSYSNLDGVNWNFEGRFYYFPNFISATGEQAALHWSAYPNPATEGVWVEAPAGVSLQIADLQGRILYRGIAEGKEFIPLRQRPDAQHVVLTIGQGVAASSRLILINR